MNSIYVPELYGYNKYFPSGFVSSPYTWKEGEVLTLTQFTIKI